MTTKKLPTTQQIIDAAGGFIDLSYEIRVSQFGLRNWLTKGIPQGYWKMLSEKEGVKAAGISFDVIAEVSKKARERFKRKRAAERKAA